jgi:hypothetical protein
MKIADFLMDPQPEYGEQKIRGKEQKAHPVGKLALDLTYLEAPVPEPKQAEDTHFALGRRYPITDLVQVKTAAAYFEEYANRFELEERREFAYNLCKRAFELHHPDVLGDKARTYGGEPIDDLDQAKVAFEERRPYAERAGHLHLFNQVVEKLAFMDPRTRLAALINMDKVAGVTEHYGPLFHDPYKQLLQKVGEGYFSEDRGGIYVSANNLTFLAKAGQKEIRDVFSDEIASRMLKDPIGTYKNLPDEQKTLMARLAERVSGTGDYEAGHGG